MQRFHPFDPNDWLARHPKVMAAAALALLLVLMAIEEVR